LAEFKAFFFFRVVDKGHPISSDRQFAGLANWDESDLQAGRYRRT
jgi:hypothetical protein